MLVWMVPVVFLTQPTKFFLIHIIWHYNILQKKNTALIPGVLASQPSLDSCLSFDQEKIIDWC